MNVARGNRKIAKFMDFKHRSLDLTGEVRTQVLTGQKVLPLLRYDCDWEWLMDAVERMFDILNKEYPGNYDYWAGIVRKQLPDRRLVYKTVVRFVEWYEQEQYRFPVEELQEERQVIKL